MCCGGGHLREMQRLFRERRRAKVKGGVQCTAASPPRPRQAGRRARAEQKGRGHVRLKTARALPPPPAGERGPPRVRRVGAEGGGARPSARAGRQRGKKEQKRGPVGEGPGGGGGCGWGGCKVNLGQTTAQTPSGQGGGRGARLSPRVSSEGEWEQTGWGGAQEQTRETGERKGRRAGAQTGEGARPRARKNAAGRQREGIGTGARGREGRRRDEGGGAEGTAASLEWAEGAAERPQ